MTTPWVSLSVWPRPGSLYQYGHPLGLSMGMIHPLGLSIGMIHPLGISIGMIHPLGISIVLWSALQKDSRCRVRLDSLAKAARGK